MKTGGIESSYQLRSEEAAVSSGLKIIQGNTSRLDASEPSCRSAKTKQTQDAGAAKATQNTKQQMKACLEGVAGDIELCMGK
jgi:hypothetical protein